MLYQQRDYYMTTEVEVPKEYKKVIADLEARLDENKREALEENYQRVTPSLKPISIFADQPPEVVLFFMKKYRLVTLKDVGDFGGVTRQRVEHLMNKQRKDIDFKEFKQKVKNFVDPPVLPDDITSLKGEEWRQLKEIDGNQVEGEYFVSNKGRACKVVEGEVRGISYRVRKLIMCKPDQNGRIRAGIRFEGEPKRGNYYVNTLVGVLFLKNNDPEVLTVVSHKDDDFSNNDVDNLFWESKAKSLIRKRSPKVKGQNKGERAASNKKKVTKAKRNTSK